MGSCSAAAELAKLEGMVQAHCSIRSTARYDCDQALAAYEGARAGVAYRDQTERPGSLSFRCRADILNKALCDDSPVFLRNINLSLSAVAYSRTWSRYMVELTNHTTAVEDCRHFDQYHALSWKPYVFRWADGPASREVDSADIAETITVPYGWPKQAQKSHHAKKSCGAAQALRVCGGIHLQTLIPAGKEYDSDWRATLEDLSFGPIDRQAVVKTAIGKGGTRLNTTHYPGRKLLLHEIAVIRWEPT